MSAHARPFALEHPPPPHDPRERRFVLWLGEWQVLIHDDRKFQYFIARGLWHLQLWHPDARISILSPSRLTCGRWEIFSVPLLARCARSSIAQWKILVASWDGVAAAIRRSHGVEVPDEATFARIKKALVDDVRLEATVPS